MLGPTQHPQKTVSSVSGQLSLPLGIAMGSAFYCRPLGESEESRARGGAGRSGRSDLGASGGLGARQLRIIEAVRTPWGSYVGQLLLTPGRGARLPTTSPLLCAESQCLHRWPSGQCLGPRDEEGAQCWSHPRHPNSSLLAVLRRPYRVLEIKPSWPYSNHPTNSEWSSD